MKQVYRILLILIVTCAFTLPLYALSLTSSNYILANPRIVSSGGEAYSTNYSITDVGIGSAFGSTASSANYSLTADRPYQRRYPPNPPTINPITSPTNIAVQTISGTKDKGTSIYLVHETLTSVTAYEAVPLNNNTTWSYDVTLEEGTDTLTVTSRNVYNLESTPVNVCIVLDTVPPIIIINTPADGTVTYDSIIAVTGTIDKTVRGVIDIIPFSEERNLNPGANTITKETTDDAGNTSSKSIDVYKARTPIALP